MENKKSSGTKTLFISAEVTETVLDWPSMIDAIRCSYAVPHGNRTSFRAVARDEGVWMRSLVSVPPNSAVMGAKIFGRSSGRGVSYLVPLFDRVTSELLALIDGRHLTALRTAATSAVAVDLLAKPGALNLGVIGSGGEARAHVKAIANVRSIDSIAVYSPTPQKREQFAADLARELNVKCHAVSHAEQAVSNADLVVCAARSHDERPVLDGNWLMQGTLLVSIGSTIPEQRELDIRSIERCDLIVCDMLHEVADETGDFIEAKAQGLNFSSKLATLNDLVLGRLSERVRTSRMPMYKSVGAAIQDLTVAELAWRRAVDAGLARELEMSLTLQQV
ncbi:Ornithine cyclodeaminase [Pseudomonas syringae pv. philadelphi]|uniref:Ornithine cyclodeaminase n=1 Tax=Pseudomonas syringae pv. philadelphi TaxID=251706 RepID=A0A3M3YK51_9PSED|nr:ornithine cyclodeaminase family protein [Pseudomonas syringae group genomosp. 3]RMO82907.1 Ornithine cyclodeaminase [Pseudomonas syringae pv. philadelphi]